MSNQDQKSGQPRILARQLARPLTNEEIEFVAGGMRTSADLVAGAVRPSADTWCETGCPCSNDSGT
jgi:hypothetical protein